MRAFVLVAIAGCASGSPVGGDGGVAGRCAGELPAFATKEGAALRASCGVSAEAYADGIVKLRYGDATSRSWAVVSAAQPVDVTIGGEAGAAMLCTSTLSVRIADDCRVTATLADGTVIVDDARPFTVGNAAKLERVARNDRVYGLGERTGGLDRRGHTWTFWNTDAYDPAVGGWHPGQDPLYMGIPFELHVSDGKAFGLFTDATRRMTIELGARDRVEVSGARSIEQYVFAGPKPADVVERYTWLVGRPALPPRWALGFHQSRWGYGSASELEAIAARFRSEQLPADALWLDIQHMRGYRSFTFDPQTFGDPAGMMSRLRAQGFRVIAIEDPGIKVDPAWSLYESGRAGGHFVGGATPYVGTAWPGPSSWPDFSRAATRDWWGGLVEGVLAQGVAGIWLDVNEPTTFPEGGAGTTLPDELVVDGDGTPTTMAELHNVYGLLQARATYEAIAARGRRPFVLSRAGFAGIQRYAATWTGDTPSTWSGLAQTLPMLLGLGVSGVPIAGSDIGGYSGHATADLYARWLALGSISPFARAHVTSGVPGQEPWMFGADVLDAARERLADRYRLLPYLYSLADEAARTGAPILRPLVWEFPDDPMVGDLGDEAMLGSHVLVAPVVTEGAVSRTVYLPAGRWFEASSGAIFDGPTTVDVSIRLAALPMFVREGAIIPHEGGVIDVYPGKSPSTFTLYEDDGESLSTAFARTTIELEPRADGAHVKLTRTGSLPIAARDLVIRVHRVEAAGSVEGATSFAFDADDRSLSATVRDAASIELGFHYDPQVIEKAPPVAVTFDVQVPADTPMTSAIHVATSANGWTHAPLAWVAPGHARGTVTLPRGEWFDYKYTRGDWTTVEKLASCGERSNRTRIAAATLRSDSVPTWRDRCGN